MKSFCLRVMVLFFFSGCTVSFKGVSIPAEVKTYYVPDVELDRAAAINSPVELPITFGEALKLKIQNESRLVIQEEDADILFVSTVKKYIIEPVAPEEGNTTALNRLEIAIAIEYQNKLNEEDNWTKTFSDFEDFPANQSLIEVETDLINTIIDDLTERIFNEAFTDW